MAFCKNCGAELIGEEKFCSSCGTQTDSQTNGASPEVDLGEKFKNFNNTADTTYEYSAQDISDNKGLTVLSYISWLVLIPLFARQNSPFAQFHAKQGFTLAVFGTAYTIATRITAAILYWVLPTFLKSTVDLIFGLGSLAFVALAVIGIINVANGRAKELPIIGRIRILK